MDVFSVVTGWFLRQIRCAILEYRAVVSMRERSTGLYPIQGWAKINCALENLTSFLINNLDAIDEASGVFCTYVSKLLAA